MAFPTDLDTFPNVSDFAGTPTGATSPTQTGVLAMLIAAIQALEARLGIDGSTDPDSIEARLAAGGLWQLATGDLEPVDAPDSFSVATTVGGILLDTTANDVGTISLDSGQQVLAYAATNAVIKSGQSGDGVLTLQGLGTDNPNSVVVEGESGVSIDAGADALHLDTGSGNDIKIGESVTGGDIHLGYGGGGTTSIKRDGGTIEVRADTGYIYAYAGVETHIEAGTDLYLNPAAGGPGNLIIDNLPTSDPGIPNAIWNDSGTLKISP